MQLGAMFVAALRRRAEILTGHNNNNNENKI